MVKRVTWRGNTKVIEEAPMTCSPASMRIALMDAGALAQVEQIAADHPEAFLRWEYAREIRRDSPLIDALKGDTFTDEQIDGFFMAAMALDEAG